MSNHDLTDEDVVAYWTLYRNEIACYWGGEVHTRRQAVEAWLKDRSTKEDLFKAVLKQELLASGRSLFLSEQRAEEITTDCVDWAREAKNLGNDRDAVRYIVKLKYKRKYATGFGSIWMMLLFSIAWKLIEKWLFD